MAKNSLGQKLQILRKSKNLTQEKLAEISGVNEKHISKIETGVYFPRYATLLKLLKALGLSDENIELDINAVKIEYNPFYLKSLQILNSASDEHEHEYFFGVLKQAQKGMSVLKSK